MLIKICFTNYRYILFMQVIYEFDPSFSQITITKLTLSAYNLSFFLSLLQSLKHRIQKYYYFWMCGSGGNCKLVSMAWNKCSLGLKESGFSIRNVISLNKALLQLLAWKLWRMSVFTTRNKRFHVTLGVTMLTKEQGDQINILITCLQR